MNGDDMIRALESKRDECDAAIGQLRHILALISGPTLPVKIDRPALERAATGAPAQTRRPPKVPDAGAEAIVAYLQTAGPSRKADILKAVPGTSPEHLQQLVTAKRVVATGHTVSRRYSVPLKHGKAAGQPESEVVWNGGGGLSSYQQQAMG